MVSPNRRSMLIGAALSPAATDSSAARVIRGPAEETCLRFVELQDRSRTLSDEWPVLESWLDNRYPGFVGMSDAEQARFPEAARFDAILHEMRAIDAECEKLLPTIRKLKCRTPGAMIARLMVAERMIDYEENEAACKLLGASLRDLGRFHSVKTWQWTTPWPNRNGPGTSDYEPS